MCGVLCVCVCARARACVCACVCDGHDKTRSYIKHGDRYQENEERWHERARKDVKGHLFLHISSILSPTYFRHHS